MRSGSGTTSHKDLIMYISRLRLRELDTESPLAIMTIQTARGARRRSVPVTITRDKETGYRWIDKTELVKNIKGVGTQLNVAGEPVDGGAQ